jgi:glycosyltransferase involved in cell wall biosynthesis
MESRRSLVFVSRRAPFPQISGAPVRTHRLLTGLAETFEVTLVTLEHEPGSPDAGVTTAEARRLLPGIRVVAAKGLGAGKRGRQARTLLSRHSWEWSRYAVPGLRRLLISEVESRRPDIVHFDDVGVGLLGPVPGTVSAFAPHNVEHRILQGIADASSGPRRWFARLESRKVEREERSLWAGMSLCLAVSNVDAEAMRAGGARRVELCPNGTDPVPMLPRPRRRPDEPFRILFVGAGTYHPYARGLSWFVKEVQPLVRQAVPALFDIVGVPPRHPVGGPGVRYVGQVEELRPWYEGTHAVVVPVFEGSGTRLKVIEAAAWGRPIVSTTLGAEGLPVRGGVDYLAADDPRTFADALISIARWSETDAPALGDMVASARETITPLFWPRITARLVELYSESVGAPPPGVMESTRTAEEAT